MYTLGIHGGINTIRHFRVATPSNWLHDAAAVLCRDGDVVAASEEERFTRIKHVTHFPIESIRYCLQNQNITLDDVDKVVLTSEHMNAFAHMVNNWLYGTRAFLEPQSFSRIAAGILGEEFGVDVSQKLLCAGHHLSHALSAVWLSGFEDCLCVVMDGWGDGLTGLVASFHNGQLEILGTTKQLGPATLYQAGTALMGFFQFDEYKVMGLAPYGRPERFAPALEQLVVLESNGRFDIQLAGADWSVLKDGFRTIGAPLEQRHSDLAAALQVVVEKVFFHVVQHFRRETGHKYLCLAGGFAQNCTAAGKILTSGLFKDVFVQPAAYDAGCAIGAAIHGYMATGAKMRNSRVSHVYWGYDTPAHSTLEGILNAWSDVITIEQPSDISSTAAALLAEGHVIGWVQGKAEFGARALGNRSILADPRPAENKDRINAMVKKREGFRPFAPSVLDEYLHEYFEVPEDVRSLPFMVFVVNVREPYRKLLGAVTHVDGSARVQSVSRETNERYWSVIDGFRKLTDVPMVLNTSFNNNAEPIVNTPADALNCFLSTKIDFLVIGDFLIKKKAIPPPDIVRHIVPRLSHRFSAVRQCERGETLGYYITDRYRNEQFKISQTAYDTLVKAVERHVPFNTVIDAEENQGVVSELFDLWNRRVFIGEGSH